MVYVDGWGDMTLRVERSRTILLFLFSVLCLLATFKPVGLDVDSHSYAEYFDAFSAKFGIFDKEPIFFLANYLGKQTGLGLTFLFAFYSIITTYFVLRGLNGLSYGNVYVAAVSYILIFGILHLFTQIRGGAAAAIVFFACTIFDKSKKSKFFGLIILATAFHYSAVVALILPLVSRLSLRPLFAFGILTFFLSFFLTSSFILEIGVHVLPNRFYQLMNLYFSLSPSSAPILNPLYIYLFALTALYWFGPRRESHYSEQMAFITKSVIIAFIIYFAFRSIPVIAFRLSEMLLVPCIALIACTPSSFKQRSIATVFVLIPSAAYNIFVQVRTLEFNL